MENNIIRCVNEHLDIAHNCFLNLEKLILTINNPDADIKNVHSVCREISLKETKADFSLQSVSVNASSLPGSEKFDIFSSTCDAIANRCEDFARDICKTEREHIIGISSLLTDMLQKMNRLFLLLREKFRYISENNNPDADMITQEINLVETGLDECEKLIFKKVMSLDISKGDKMQLTLLINKISKIPDVIKKASDAINI